MIKWAQKHKDDPPPPDDDENKEKRTDDIDPWDQEFLKVDQGTLFELILVSINRTVSASLSLTFWEPAVLIWSPEIKYRKPKKKWTQILNLEPPATSHSLIPGQRV